jgi:hypothetical protein
MTVGIAAAVWQLPDATNAAATFLSATDAATLTFGAAPGSGGRIDSVAVKQNNIENADADSRVNVIVIAGTASGSPVAPTMPAGYYRRANYLINAGVTNMAAATLTDFGRSTFAPPDLVAATYAALSTVTGLLGQVASVTADTAANNGMYVWNGSVWVASFGVKNYSGVPTAGAQANGANVVSQAIPSRPYAQRVIVTFAGGIVGSAPGGGGYQVVATGATVTGNTGQVSVSSTGVSYGAHVVVDIPASTSVTILIQVTATVSMTWQTGSWSMRVLTAGEY